MANPAYLNSILAPALQPETRPAWRLFIQYMLSTVTGGRVEPGATQVDRGANLQWYPVTATTPSTPNEVFSIQHGLPAGRTPYAAYPVLPLNVVGAQMVPLTVAQAADGQRIYLSSSEADAPVYLMIEG